MLTPRFLVFHNHISILSAHVQSHFFSLSLLLLLPLVHLLAQALSLLLPTVDDDEALVNEVRQPLGLHICQRFFVGNRCFFFCLLLP